jgi:hypothetical protein
MFNPIGQRFGKWIVLSRYGKQGKQPTWLCKCDCGNKGIVPSYNLKIGRSTNCGCVRREKMSACNITHGKRNSRLYHIWCGMKHRCTCETAKDFQNYGGRGVTLYENWLSFEPFYEWSMKNGYEDHLTIDRIDNDKGYFPDNCRWAGLKTQANNRRSNHFVEYNNEVKTLAEWCNILKLDRNFVSARLKRGWSIEKAFSTPKKGTK